MSEELRLADLVVENIKQGVMVTDANSKILAVNPAFSTITGYSREDVVGQRPSLLNSGKQDELFYIEMWSSILEKGFWEGEIWNRKKDGTTYLEHLLIRSIPDRQGAIQYYIGIFSDITERKRRENQVKFKAYRDCLTGLPNRNLLYDRLETLLQEADAVNEPFAVLFLDLDRFKTINDTLGHHIGDLILKTVAHRLTSCTRAGDTVARLGGDEFIVLLPGVGHERNAVRVAQKIIDEFMNPCTLEGHEVLVSASIGIVMSSSSDRTAADVINLADVAMYEAKKRGRNNYHLFSSGLLAKISERDSLEAQLRSALYEGGFVLHYQPQYDVRLGTIIGAEALIRWQHPEKGLLFPGQFIPLAEETGFIVPMGEWVLRTACEQAKLWREYVPHFKIAVNLSVRQLEQAYFYETISKILQETGLPPKNLELELTESLMLFDHIQIADELQQLKSLGITLSIDDFGTGYSSYNLLRRMPFDKLKLDRSFIQELDLQDAGVEIVEGIINMAHRLRLEVVAEGVESKKQLEYLHKWSCDYAQGFFFQKALPADHFEKLIHSPSQPIAASPF